MDRFYPRMNNTANGGANNGYTNDYYGDFNNYSNDYNSYNSNYTNDYGNYNDDYPADYHNDYNGLAGGLNGSSWNNGNSTNNGNGGNNGGNNGNGSGNGNGGSGNNGNGNSNCRITNTATVRGYVNGHGSSDPTLVTGEDSVTLGCIMADISKTADRESANAGDRIRYTITFRNMSDREMYNVTITDQLSPYLNAIATTINPAPQMGESLETGINIGRVPANASRTLTFTATVTDDVSEDIVNRAFADFNFRGANGQEQSASTPITSVTTTVENAGITVNKTANKNYVTANGEEVEFTITVTNNSSRGITDLVITDQLPANLVYVEDSTYIGDEMPINANPTGGIYIGELDGGDSITVRFSATVNLRNNM